MSMRKIADSCFRILNHILLLRGSRWGRDFLIGDFVRFGREPPFGEDIRYLLERRALLFEKMGKRKR